jgi:D-glycero-alpha-D-manno-heptose-7-phosphate kinase
VRISVAADKAQEVDVILVSRAPVRISFGGGGTDFPEYYERHGGGMVVSTTINYYVYTILSPGHPSNVQIISSDYRTLCQSPQYEDLIWNGDLQLPKAITYYFQVHGGVNIFLASQVPPGTGLGSSGSVAVSMIKALAFWCGLDFSPREVAELACYIEMEKMEMPVGKQDQYASAFGGLNRITFSRAGVTVDPLSLAPETRETLEQSLLLFFTGTSRQSSTILRQQRRASLEDDPAILRRLGAIKELGMAIYDALQAGDLTTFGELLHRSWLQKRRLAEGVTNPLIDEAYRTAREQGALGGKVTGAGGGGFLMLFCPVERQQVVINALTAMGLKHRPFAFESDGVQAMSALSADQAHISPQIISDQLSVG